MRLRGANICVRALDGANVYVHAVRGAAMGVNVYTAIALCIQSCCCLVLLSCWDGMLSVVYTQGTLYICWLRKVMPENPENPPPCTVLSQQVWQTLLPGDVEI